nr:TRAP transporter small permease subunit [Ardenticatena sp.]
MRFIEWYVKAVDALSEGLGWLSQMLVIVTVVIGFYNVVARYAGRFMETQLSSNLYIELQWYLFSLVFFFGFAYILKHGINVRVDFLYAQWPKKRQAMIDFWGHIFFLIPFTILGIYVTIDPVLFSWRLNEMSPDPGGLPRAPLKTMIIVAFVTLLLQTISELIKLYGVITDNERILSIGAPEEHEEPLRIE